MTKEQKANAIFADNKKAVERRRTFAHIHKKIGLPEHGAEILKILTLEKTKSQTQLASNLGISKATIGVIIKILLRRDYIKRVRDYKDARNWLVSITAKGEDSYKFLQKLYSEIYDIGNKSLMDLLPCVNNLMSKLPQRKEGYL